MIISPTDGYSKDYIIVSCYPDYAKNYITIIIDKAKATGLLLNNQTFLTTATAYPIPSTNLVAYQHLLKCSGAAATFRIIHPDVSVVFGVIAYGLELWQSYAYMAGRLVGPSSYFCTSPADSNPPDVLDNDCDGWVDEELRNFIDDDNDGLIDEDLASEIPLIFNVTDAQIFSPNLTAPPPSTNGSEPRMPSASADKKCTPYNMSYIDNMTEVHPSYAVTHRKWTLKDKCGNIADDKVQIIIVCK